MSETISFFKNEKFLLWNIGTDKIPILKNGSSGGWSKITYEQSKKYFDETNNNIGMRTGIQESGKYIIGLDFDIMKKDEATKAYSLECTNTKKFYTDFLGNCDGDVTGIFKSSTCGNYGILVDVTENKSIVDLLDNIAATTFQRKDFHLEIRKATNYALPPSKTTCKCHNKMCKAREFMKLGLHKLNNKNEALLESYIKAYFDETYTKPSPRELRNNKKAEGLEILNVIMADDNDDKKIPIAYLSKFLNILNGKRGDDYHSWIRIGSAIQNSYGDKGFEVFNEWSKNHEGYDEFSVKTHWNNLSKYSYPFTWRYILKFCKLDSWDKTALEMSKLFKDQSHSKEVGEYEKVKAEFEKNHAKIEEEFCYVMETQDGEVKMVKEKDLKTKAQNFSTWRGKIHCASPYFIDNWLKDPNIRTYRRTDFAPYGASCPNDVYNLFNGFRIENIIKKNDKLVENKDGLSIFLNHVKKVVGIDKQDDCFKYLVAWFAQLIQQPGCKSRTAPVIKGIEGAGKTVLFDWIGNKILGDQYYISTPEPKYILGNFNSALDRKLLVNLDESNKGDNDKYIEIMKTLITNKTIVIERKGIDAQKQQNFSRVGLTTNNDLVVKLTPSDRRFQLFESDSSCANNKDYFDKLLKAMEDDNTNYAIYNYLKSVKIDDFDFINNRVDTNFSVRSTKSQFDPVYEFIQQFVENNKANEYKNKKQCKGYSHKIKKSEFYKLYSDFMNVNFHGLPKSRNYFDNEIRSFNNIDEGMIGGNVFWKFNPKDFIDTLKSKKVYQDFMDGEMNSEEPIMNPQDDNDDLDDNDC